VGAVDQDNILHICAKRQVSKSVFESIMKNLSADSKAKLLQAKDSDGNLPLHLSVRTNTMEESYICEKLIEEIKQIRCTDGSQSDGRVTSHILDILFMKNRRGKTAAHEASEQGHVHILKIMEKAVSLNDWEKGLYMRDDNNMFTCLHIAAMDKNDKGQYFLHLLSTQF
jgi:ankyrin repeat protein